MERDIVDNALIDPNLDSHQQFFDHGWSKRMFEAVEKSPLKDAVDALMIAWRSANGAHLLPWLMVHSLKRFAEGEGNGILRCRDNYSGEVVKGLVAKLDSRMHHNLQRDQRALLKRVVAKIEKEAYQNLKTAQSQVEFPVAGYWEFLTQSSEFHFCILGTQRINYGSLFFAYEDFLANVIRTKDPAYSSKDKKNPIPVALTKHFDKSLAAFCWDHCEVDLARLIRNALAHNGGRFGPDLEKKHKARFVDATGNTAVKLQDDLFIVVNGKIQIVPGNTKHLFGILKERVTKIVKATRIDGAC
jgi:hypothetical protein